MLAASRHMTALLAVPTIAVLAIRCMHKRAQGFKHLLYLGFRDLLYWRSIDSIHAEQVSLPWRHRQICHLQTPPCSFLPLPVCVLLQ